MEGISYLINELRVRIREPTRINGYDLARGLEFDGELLDRCTQLKVFLILRNATSDAHETGADVTAVLPATPLARLVLARQLRR